MDINRTACFFSFLLHPLDAKSLYAHPGKYISHSTDIFRVRRPLGPVQIKGAACRVSHVLFAVKNLQM